MAGKCVSAKKISSGKAAKIGSVPKTAVAKLTVVKNLR